MEYVKTIHDLRKFQGQFRCPFDNTEVIVVDDPKWTYKCPKCNMLFR